MTVPLMQRVCGSTFWKNLARQGSATHPRGDSG